MMAPDPGPPGVGVVEGVDVTVGGGVEVEDVVGVVAHAANPNTITEIIIKNAAASCLYLSMLSFYAS